MIVCHLDTTVTTVVSNDSSHLDITVVCNDSKSLDTTEA